MWTAHAEHPGAPFGGQRGIVDKDLHKLIVRQWQEPRAVLMYILQGRFVASLAAAEVAHMLRRVVNPTSHVVNMLTTLSKINIEAFAPPMADGSELVLRQPEDQFNDWGEGRGCNIFVPVLGGNGTKIAPTGDIFDQPPGQMR